MTELQNSINLHELPIQQLQAVRQQIEEELQILTQSFAKLKQAQQKFTSCNDSLKSLESEKSLLVPLTNSLYVTGTFEEPGKVIVDVGTGYFVEKNLDEASDFYKRKVEYVKGNLEKLENTVNQRQGQRRVLLQVLQEKIIEEQKKEKEPKE
jgi:prefoldin alpha subunit